MEDKIDVIVIGAGAAGLMAAGKMAECGVNVVLLEKMEKTARKLRITGKGRCNITNTKSHEDFLRNVFSDQHFINPALRNFDNVQTINFFNNLGLKTVTERGGRVFPDSGKAWDVAKCLEKWTEKAGTKIICNARVKEINIENGKAVNVDVEICKQTRKMEAKYILIATGGVSYPLTGSTGDGYTFAKKAGHKITKILPSLVPLEIKNHDKTLNKLQLKNVEMQLRIDGGLKNDEFGEMEFNETGITGAITLRLSREAIVAINENKKVDIIIDIKPALTAEQLKNRIARELESVKNNETLLQKLLPKQFICNFAKKAKIHLSAKTNQSDIGKIIETLKAYKLEVSGHRDFNEAIVTNGGVSLKDIDFRKMKSKLVDNMYFAGEVLDIDANTGGYNLQIAFSTAVLAAQSIVKELKP